MLIKKWIDYLFLIDIIFSMIKCDNSAFRYGSNEAAIIIIMILEAILFLFIIFMMCRLCSKAFSYSHFHIHQAYKFYTLALLSTTLVILSRYTQIKIIGDQDKDVIDMQKGYLILNEILASASFFAMNQLYTQSGFTWLMISLGCDFSGSTAQIQILDEDVLIKRRKIRKIKIALLYVILPILAFVGILGFLLRANWCAASIILLIVSGLIATFSFCFPLLKLLKERWYDPITSKYTKICWAYLSIAIIVRQITLVALMIVSLSEGDAVNPFENTTMSILGVFNVILVNIIPIICLIYLAQGQLQKQKCSMLKGSSAMIFGSFA